MDDDAYITNVMATQRPVWIIQGKLLQGGLTCLTNLLFNYSQVLERTV